MASAHLSGEKVKLGITLHTSWALEERGQASEDTLRMLAFGPVALLAVGPHWSPVEPGRQALPAGGRQCNLGGRMAVRAGPRQASPHSPAPGAKSELCKIP